MMQLNGMTGKREDNLSDARPGDEVATYVAACRQRVPGFIAANYGWRSAIALNRKAIGSDVVKAPFNFLMGLPNFLLHLLALLFDVVGARRIARVFARSHFGLPTTVQGTVRTRLMTDLLHLSADKDGVDDNLRQRICAAAQEPVRIYVQTRNVAADITAGTIAALVGLVLLNQFTPGSISASTVFAHAIAREQAVSEFPLGETIGGVVYSVFPVTPSLTTLALVLLVVMVIIAVVAALSGFIHDPLQKVTGIHRRRLHRMLDAIEESLSDNAGRGYRPKDTFVGRVYDAVDWLKGLLSF